MLNIINKSVKTLNNGINSIVNGLTNENSFKTEIDFCNFDTLQLDLLKVTDKELDQIYQENQQNLMKEYNVFFLVNNKTNFCIFYLTEEFDFKCIFNSKLTFPITSAYSLNFSINCSFNKDFPIIGLISNSQDNHQNLDNRNNYKLILNKNESNLKFYSLKTKKIVFNLRFKKKIMLLKSQKNYFAVSLGDGSIKLYDYKINNFYTVNFNEKLLQENTYLFNCPIFDITDTYLLYYNNNRSIFKQSDNADTKQVSKIINRKSSSNQKNNKSSFIKNNSPLKNSINKINIIDDKSENLNYQQTSTQIENFAGEVYKNISNLKDWSLSQLKDLSNLRNATNVSNKNDLIDQCNNGVLILQKIIVEEMKVEERGGRKLSSDKEKSVDKNNNNNKPIEYSKIKINIPFFENGISIVKFFNGGKYFIVGNKGSQMFYLYEIYPQTNLKYSIKNETTYVNHFKISYSIYRGMTSAFTNSVALSSCKKFVTIGSNKGTFHVYYLPKKDNQILENASDFDYDNFQEINQRVICSKDMEKIRMKNFLSNYTYKSSCTIESFNKIDINKNFTQEMKESLLKNKFRNYANGSVMFTFSENDPNIYLYYLNKNSTTTNQNKSVFLMKKVPINFSYDDESEVNLNNFMTHSKIQPPNNFNNLSKLKSYFKELIDIVTTDKNFPNIHNNPLFTFNIISDSKNNIIPFKKKESKSKIITTKPKIIEEKNESCEISPSVSLDTKQLKSCIINFNTKTSFKQILKLDHAISFAINSSYNKVRQSINYKSSRSGSINYKMPIIGLNNSFVISGNQTSNYRNDVSIHEKIICNDINYSIKNFNSENLIINSNDFSNNNDHCHYPKLIVYPSNYQLHNLNTKKKVMLRRINTSISDSSSNSISLNNINVHNEIVSTDEISNNNSFYHNKENILKNQILRDIHSNIIDNFKNNNVDAVKVIGNFSIDDNYCK